MALASGPAVESAAEISAVEPDCVASAVRSAKVRDCADAGMTAPAAVVIDPDFSVRVTEVIAVATAAVADGLARTRLNP